MWHKPSDKWKILILGDYFSKIGKLENFSDAWKLFSRTPRFLTFVKTSVKKNEFLHFKVSHFWPNPLPSTKLKNILIIRKTFQLYVRNHPKTQNFYNFWKVSRVKSETCLKMWEKLPLFLQLFLIFLFFYEFGRFPNFRDFKFWRIPFDEYLRLYVIMQNCSVYTVIAKKAIKTGKSAWIEEMPCPFSTYYRSKY